MWRLRLIFLSLTVAFVILNLSTLWSFTYHDNDNEYSISIVPLDSDRPSEEDQVSGRSRHSQTSDKDDPLLVGTFNGHDLYFVDEPPKSRVHCVGDTYQEETSWLYRSCEYTQLCFDLDRLDFVIYKDDISAPLPEGWYSSTLREEDPVTGMEVNARPRDGAIHATPNSQPKGLFYPRTINAEPPSSHYQLNVTMIPFFRYKIGYRNPGHHLWQDLISLYTLIEMFGREDTEILLVPLKQRIAKKYYREGGADLMNKWGAKLMGMPNFDEYNPFWEDSDFDLRIAGQPASLKSLSSRVICAHGLTGVGHFSHHETHHQNGTHIRDRLMNRELVPANNGRGGFFRRMRQFMMRKVGIEGGKLNSKPRLTMLFSQHSSTRGNRANNTFQTQIDYLQSVFAQAQVQIEGVTLSKMTIEEQIQKLSSTDVFVSAVGGGTASAFFLPRGSHLILFYESGLLDWDYWNNIPDIHVHWIPIQHLDDPAHLPNLKLLVEECLGLAKLSPRQRTYKYFRMGRIAAGEESSRETDDTTAMPPTSPTFLAHAKSGLCNGYDGILRISRVFKKAATGTFFFQSMVDSLLYARQHNLYPFIWIDQMGKSQPCFDPIVHGNELQATYSHLLGHINSVHRLNETSQCRHEPGPPVFNQVKQGNVELRGNGIWQSYFQMTHPIPFDDLSCHDKPTFSLSQTQVLPGLHYCSETAVRGWVYPNLDPSLKPNLSKNQTMKGWLTEHRKRASSVIQEHFRLQPWLQEKVDMVQPKNTRCLAVHIRLTDKGSGRIKQGVDSYLPYVESYVKATREDPDATIFLATDDSTVMHQLLNASQILESSRIRSQQGLLLSDSNSPTFSTFKAERHRINTETLVDIYGLSRCQYLVHGASAVAEAAIYLNLQLDQFSVNIDDENTLTPREFQVLIESSAKPPIKP